MEYYTLDMLDRVHDKNAKNLLDVTHENKVCLRGTTRPLCYYLPCP